MARARSEDKPKCRAALPSSLSPISSSTRWALHLLSTLHCLSPTITSPSTTRTHSIIPTWRSRAGPPTSARGSASRWPEIRLTASACTKALCGGGRINWRVGKTRTGELDWGKASARSASSFRMDVAAKTASPFSPPPHILTSLPTLTHISPSADCPSSSTSQEAASFLLRRRPRPSSPGLRSTCRASSSSLVLVSRPKTVGQPGSRTTGMSSDGFWTVERSESGT